MAITFNNVGYFVEGFSVKECERFHVVSPVLKGWGGQHLFQMRELTAATFLVSGPGHDITNHPWTQVGR
jgi:hypothetical protein